MRKEDGRQDETGQSEKPIEMPIGTELIDSAQKLIGLRLTDEEQKLMQGGVNQNLQRYEQLLPG